MKMVREHVLKWWVISASFIDYETTYDGWNIWPISEKCLDTVFIYCYPLLKYEVVGHLDLWTLWGIINATVLDMPFHISSSTCLIQLRVFDQTAGTWILPQELDPCKQHSMWCSVLVIRMTKIHSNLPFGVICWVTEESREYSTHDPIVTSDDQSMVVSVHELLVEKKCPYCLEQLSFTVHEYLSSSG